MTDDKTIPPAKPLTQGQVRNLTKLVINDYEQAERELQMKYREALTEGHARLDEEFALRSQEVAAVKSEIETMQADWRARFKEFEEQLIERGFERDPGAANRNHGYTSINLASGWQIAGRSERRAKLQTNLEQAFQVALHTLRTARAAAERQILLASITTEAAQDVLAKIPKAADLFATSIEAPLPDLTEAEQRDLGAAAYVARQVRGVGDIQAGL